MKKIIVMIIGLLIGFQINGKSQDLEIGLFGGGSYYNGEINPGKPFMQTKMAYGLLARYNLNKRMALRLNAYRGTLTGDDAVAKYKEDRGLSFTSDITDLSVIFEFNFLPFFVGSEKSYWTTYIFGGASVFFFNPKAGGVELREIGTEGQNIGFEGREKYSLTGFSIPFGLGLKYSLTKRIGIGLEWGMHKTYTDYIDDISSTYYLNGSSIDPENTAGVLSDPTLSHGVYEQRGNPEKNDWFSFAGLSITYKFNLQSRARCLNQQTFN